MANEVKFEGKERRMAKIEACLAEYGIESLEAARELCLSKGIDVEAIVKGVQPIAFENAVWAYTIGVAVALKKGVTNAADAAAAIGIGLQAFCIPGSVAEQRNVGLGHGNLGAMLLTRGDPAASASSQGMSLSPRRRARSASPVPPTRFARSRCSVILNGLGKDAAYIISRINGFTYVQTDYDFHTGELSVVKETAFSDGEKAKVRCYGANDVLRGRGHHEAGECRCVHHRQLDQPDPVPASGCRHL